MIVQYPDWLRREWKFYSLLPIMDILNHLNQTFNSQSTGGRLLLNNNTKGNEGKGWSWKIQEGKEEEELNPPER